MLDLVGGYGANLFGHHHPELVAVAHRHFEERRPFHAQASCRPGAARLAESLCRQLGDYVVTFTNSGAETIEAALEDVLLERPRPVFWAVKGAFHGKTLGAIQFTWSYRHHTAVTAPEFGFLIPPIQPAGTPLSRKSKVLPRFFWSRSPVKGGSDGCPTNLSDGSPRSATGRAFPLW